MTFTPEITRDDIVAVGDLTSADMTPFIATASLIAEESLSPLGFSDARLRLIGIYLTAHFALLKEGQIKSEKIGDSSTTFNMSTGLALDSTTHGQQAMFLDTSGTLAQLNKSAQGGDSGSTEGSISVF